MTDGLVEFLRARLDETERIARQAADRSTDAWLEVWNATVLWPDRSVGCYDEEVGEHIALHDPARVLRGVEAKRAILERYGFVQSHGPAKDHVRAMDMTVGASGAMLDVLKMLALEWADHEDYRPEWKP